MQTYLIIRKFERRRNKRGQSYGMAVSYYQNPEDLWGCEHVTRAYKERAGAFRRTHLHKGRRTVSGWV